ncbi:MAG: FecR family protein [Blastocatellia bacterium]|nr:FecR family protein [Blastocatellia bacterium]
MRSLWPLWAIFAACLPWLVETARAQVPQVEARVAGLSGGSAQRIVSGRGAFPLRTGDALSPGDEIDTRGGARVRIEMTDGSVINLLPGSRLLLKDYRAAGSLRDLFEIIAGRVRIKVNRFGGKPNPVRVNTPSASIAVRGTEFDVIVNRRETRVAVYEGLVEVSDRRTPRRRALVEPGRGVIVRPNQDLRFFLPGPASDIGDHSPRRTPEENLIASTTPLPTGADATATLPAGLNPGNPVRALAGQYERYLDSVVEPGETPPLMRFLAFPDSHLDSLENPAYATEFGAFAGRTILLPGLRRIHGADGLRPAPEIELPRPYDFSVLSQTSVFLPIPNSRFVLGGSFATTQGEVHSLAQNELDLTPPPSPFQVTGLRTTSTEAENRSFTGSLILARRFGVEGRTSAGIAVDHLHGRGALTGVTSLKSSLDPELSQIGFLNINAREELQARTIVDRTRLRIGVTHEFGRGHKLGLYFHQGVSSAADRDRTRTFNGLPLPLDSVRYSSQVSETGLRLRGSLSRRLFYGLEANWLTVGVNEEIRRAVIVESNERERIHRFTFGGAIGFAPWRRTIFNLDLASGLSNARERLYELATGNQIEDLRERMRFVSAHVSTQTDVWRGSYVMASLLAIRQRNIDDITVSPDRFGRRLTSFGLPGVDGRTQRSFTDPLSDFGAGWRFKESFVLQYVYSTDFKRTPPSHVLVISYTFGRHEK